MQNGRLHAVTCTPLDVSVLTTGVNNNRSSVGVEQCLVQHMEMHSLTQKEHIAENREHDPTDRTRI